MLASRTVVVRRRRQLRNFLAVARLADRCEYRASTWNVAERRSHTCQHLDRQLNERIRRR